MQALTEVVRGGQGALSRLQRVAGGEDPGGARPARRREVRVEPAAVLDALARARARRHPALRGERHLADRLVAARAGRAHGQVHAGRSRRPRTAAWARSRWAPSWARYDDELLDRVQELRPVADELGVSMAQLALAWVLREPNVASAIIGASRPGAGRGQRRRRRASSSTRRRCSESTRSSATASRTRAPTPRGLRSVHGARRRGRPLGRRHQRRADGARLPEAPARERPLAADRLDLRHVVGRALRDDGGARPPRRPRGLHARASSPRRRSGPTRSGGCRCSARTTTGCPQTVEARLGDLVRARARARRGAGRGDGLRHRRQQRHARRRGRARTSSRTRRARRRPRRWRRRSSPRPPSARSCCRAASATGSRPTAPGCATSRSATRTTRTASS